MFKLNEKYEVKRSSLKGNSPSEISTINAAISPKYIEIPREDSIVSLSNSYLDLNLDVLNAATGNKYSDANDIGLLILGSLALFSNQKLTTSRGEDLQDISHAYVVCLMYKLRTKN